MAKKKIPTKQSVPTQSKVKKSNVPDLIIKNGFWKKNGIPALILFVLSIGLYLQTKSFDYVLDDKIVYHENALVKKGFGGISEIFGTESMVGYFGEQVNIGHFPLLRLQSSRNFLGIIIIKLKASGQKNLKRILLSQKGSRKSIPTELSMKLFFQRRKVSSPHSMLIFQRVRLINTKTNFFITLPTLIQE
jgi:hypothetical protein